MDQARAPYSLSVERREWISDAEYKDVYPIIKG